MKQSPVFMLIMSLGSAASGCTSDRVGTSSSGAAASGAPTSTNSGTTRWTPEALFRPPTLFTDHPNAPILKQGYLEYFVSFTVAENGGVKDGRIQCPKGADSCTVIGTLKSTIHGQPTGSPSYPLYARLEKDPDACVRVDYHIKSQSKDTIAKVPLYTVGTRTSDNHFHNFCA